MPQFASGFKSILKSYVDSDVRKVVFSRVLAHRKLINFGFDFSRNSCYIQCSIRSVAIDLILIVNANSDA